jgi:ferredoxin
LKFPELVIECKENFKEVLFMAYKIGDECISCGTCASECPVSCITEGDGKYVIDENVCVECGTCASVCPVDAPKQA